MPTVNLEKMTYGIDALGHIDGKVVFVPYGVPQDQAEIEITETKTDYMRGEIRSITASSPLRQKSPCPNFPACGGCHWLHMKSETQRREKEGYLHYLLTPLSPRNVYPIEPLSAERYRNKMELKIALDANGKVILGNYKFHSHDVVDITGCIVQCPENMKMHAAFSRLLNEDALREHATNIESIGVRTLGAQQHALISVKTPPGEEIVNHYRDFFQAQESLSRLELSAGDTSFLTLMRDKPPFEFIRRSWTVSPRSFFQNNLEGAEAIYYTLQSLYDGPPQKGKFIDLYCGVGIQTMMLEHMFEEAVGVESNMDSCNDAIRNQRGKRQQQIHFFARKAESIFGTQITRGTLSALHMNPPRTGASQRVIRGLAGVKPRMITYLSCNPMTFRRDAMAISNMGYHLNEVYAFDLFPGTFHLEILASFTR
ncbi:MAG: class I SAM-dependent RNA methyltransferase [Candidatus Riflebacteria bacterium]|nr:class I SAM-dependent RNA methyltransferase [Candidatus Riflebacteria bacterium]